MSNPQRSSPALLDEGISHLSAAHRELTEVLHDLRAELSNSLDGWEANARSAYQEVQHSWDTSVRKQQELIERLPELSKIPGGRRITGSRNARVRVETQRRTG